NATGTAGLGGYYLGINDQSSNDTIAGNLISGGSYGIFIQHQGAPGPGPTIRGNKIGTDITGTLGLDSGRGIVISGSPDGATIGGTNPGDGNTIAFNSLWGVLVSTGTGCSILGNSIFSNGSRGIMLFVTGDDVQTVNDPGDTDIGANGLQN